MDAQNELDNIKAELQKLSTEVASCHNEIHHLNEELSLLKQRSANPRPIAQRNISPAKKPVSLENLIGLKLIHFVGIIVLIIGLSIAVKYAIDVNLISPALRIVLTYLAGVVLFFLSIKLKTKYQQFSLILFSGAMASAYFTTYAAFAYYGMIPRIPAFLIMLLLTIFTVYNALKYDRQEIAILGLAGAYGIPFFVRGNSENLTALFSYIFLINTGILFLSFKKYWQSLTYIAFFTTWLIFFSSFLIATQHLYVTTRTGFAIAWFLMFFFGTAGVKLYKKEILGITEQAVLILNTAFLYGAFTTIYTNEQNLEIITLGFMAAYGAAGLILRIVSANQKPLENILFSIFMLALVAFIPMHFSGLTTTIIWGIIAICFFITGMWLRLKIFRAGAICLFAISILKLLGADSDGFTPVQKVIAYIFTGTVLLVVSFLYQRYKNRIFQDDEKD